MCANCFSHVWLFATPWTVAHQAPLSMGFSRQEYWSGLPFPLHPGGFSDPGIKLISLMYPVLAGGFFTTSATWEASQKNLHMNIHCSFICTIPQIETNETSFEEQI